MSMQFPGSDPTQRSGAHNRSVHGVHDPAFAGVADRFARQLARTDGGGSLAVYHQGRLVVDLWGGNRDGDRAWQRDTLAMCFSTTKGVAATAVHVLADRGEIDYDRPVATYWPEFGQAGKERITVRQVLSHAAGLHRFGTLVDSGRRMIDWEHMVDALARARPAYPPGTAVGYHAITFGWLVGELVRRVAGVTLAEFVQAELARPLGLGGLFIGCPAEERHRLAPLQPMSGGLGPTGTAALRSVSRALSIAGVPVNPRRIVNALYARGMEEVMYGPEFLDAQVPAMNGHFDAVSLAGLYAMLAGGGELDGVRVLSQRTVRRAGAVQNRQLDRVVVLPMEWRLGYHRLLTRRNRLPHAFGHFGFGGSGAWADPEYDVALALVVNRGGGTPMADRRIVELSEAVAGTVRALTPSR